jgi:2-keto-4-pentenoate hydratase/2-oxohepta-3-ene-1,7-dioic acid hydratase in catechol pathway
MKLTSYEIGGKANYGLVSDDRKLTTAQGDLAKKYPDLKSVIEGDALAEVGKALEAQSPDTDMGSVTMLPVIPNPGKIFCIGLNYKDHRDEGGWDDTKHPSVFTRFPETQTGHNCPMLMPKESDKFDFEAELVAIIGKGGRRISEADALNHVAGYSCYNEGSVRDYQRHNTQWIPGKNFCETGAFGPWMVTADEIPDPTTMTIKTRLNGEVMQDSSTDLLIFPIPVLLNYISTFVPLSPGDVIVTGTPGGVGARRDPQIWMKDGDVVEIDISKVGVLRNTVKKET